jgi:lipopolysaccharide export system permease protein
MSIIARYVVTRYLRILGLTMLATTGLIVVVDFFERIGRLQRYDPTFAALAGYFLFRIPSLVTEVYPAASLLAVLISLGLLARHREVLALRACGIGTWQLAVPLVLVSALISFGVLVWNETVVPPTASRSRTINDFVIKKKTFRGYFNASSLWFQGPRGFYNVDYFDANRNALYGLTLYEADPSFRLNRIIEIPAAQWRGDHWDIREGTVKNLGPNGEIIVRPLEPGEFELNETPRDFSQRRRESEEFSYAELKRQVDVLRAKGLDASEYLVDLYLKLAWPFSGLVTVLVGFPIAVRGGRRTGLARNIGIGMAIGFGYWATMAVAVSAGHTGGLPPVAAAWAANGIFALFGATLYMGREG